jgi:predicted CXXCH cytochrome family protein
MTRRILFAAAVAPLLAAGIAWGAGEYIAQSKHNFSSFAWSGNEICKPCHTPHNAMPISVSGRLWNHELTTASYTLNGSNTTTSAGTAVADMDRVSRLCLSCHDGTVALDSFGGVTAPATGTGSNIIPQYANLGTDLSNDHPVGLKAVMKDETGRYKPITYSSGTVSYNGVSLRLVDAGTTRTVTLADGTSETRKDFAVGCYTCHSAHGEGIGGTTSPNLLRADNYASKLCLTCHNK